MTTTSNSADEIRQAVQEHYGQRARRVIQLTDVTPAGVGCGADDCGQGTCGADDCGYDASAGGCGADATAAACCGPADTERAMTLYNEAQLQGLPVEAMAASAGCGNPTALADLRPGERVLDLGSGGGIDCFIAAEQVGESGQVFGLDMTKDMLDLANANRRPHGPQQRPVHRGAPGGHPPARWQRGRGDQQLRHLPVTRQGCGVPGSLSGADARRPPARIGYAGADRGRPSLTDSDAWASCVGGAEYRGAYLNRMTAAGFTDIATNDEGVQYDEDSAPLNVASVKISARKPA